MVMLAAALCGCGNHRQSNTSGDPVALSGAGATFPEPFYTMAFEAFHTKSGNTVSYGGIGSGGGVRNLKDEVVDFAGSDAFLTDDELATMRPVVHIPTCMGAVVIAYNLPNVGELRLSGDVLADIFAGKITQWNDTRIAALNPLTRLPKETIIPVYRSDGSGTTYNFTYYLSQVSPQWANTLGASKSVNFPVGQAAKGNPGVAATVGQTPYAIGYVGSEYAFAQHLAMALVANASGRFVAPSVESISAAATGDVPADTRVYISNSSAPDAYPIACFTWLLVYREQHYAGRTREQALATVALLRFMLEPGTQASAKQVYYAPLPKSMVKNSLHNLSTLTYDGVALCPEQ